MIFKAHALERTAHFLNEQRTEPYAQYGEGAVQVKNVLGAKSTSQGQTCSGPGRCGA
jgi:hypothetical protein